MKFGLEFIKKLQPCSWIYKSGHHELIGPLIKSVQELSEQVEKLDQETARLYKECISLKYTKGDKK